MSDEKKSTFWSGLMLWAIIALIMLAMTFISFNYGV